MLCGARDAGIHHRDTEAQRGTEEKHRNDLEVPLEARARRQLLRLHPAAFDQRYVMPARPGSLVAFRSETTHEVTPVTDLSYKSFGVRPVRFAIRASIFGPISSEA